jgi:hypothetical protein
MALSEVQTILRTLPRSQRLIQDAIESLELRLKDLTVLTEAATGYFALTPFIAVFAGAESVIALTRDSRFGSVDEVRMLAEQLESRLGVPSGVVEIHTKRSERLLRRADIVTNLGHVRPIDAQFVASLKSTAVVPLMWETWEHRGSDVDLTACRAHGIPVLGTNEAHPKLQTMSYVGHLALKLLFELQIEVFASRAVVLGKGAFAEAVVRSREAGGSSVVRASLDRDGRLSPIGIREELARCDAVVVAEHADSRPLFAPGCGVMLSELRDMNRGIAIAHISGHLSPEDLARSGIPFSPARIAPPGFMSATTAYLGPKPMIDLHTAGLRVGELMARARRRGVPAEQVERQVALTSELAQAFDIERAEEALP